MPARLPRGTDVGEVLAVGRDALRRLVGAYTDQGMSKFVVRRVGDTDPDRDAGRTSWLDELTWLGDAVFDLQT